MQHITGTQNIVADSLSRLFVEDAQSDEQDPVCCNMLNNFTLAFHDLSELQRQDLELVKIVQSLEKG